MADTENNVAGDSNVARDTSSRLSVEDEKTGKNVSREPSIAVHTDQQVMGPPTSTPVRTSATTNNLSLLQPHSASIPNSTSFNGITTATQRINTNRKVPGYYSLADWNSLVVPQTAPIRNYTPNQVRLHHNLEDIWIILHDKVYDVTPYMKYHPGGQMQLMRAAGRDATELFNKVHPWVNYNALLTKCFIGRCVPS
jgi:cytochrome b involved in lipid metabolism